MNATASISAEKPLRVNALAEAPDSPPLAECWRLVHQGKILTAGQVTELERILERDPQDLAARLQLLGRSHSDTLSPEAFELLAGLIEHHPGCPITGQVSLRLPAFDCRNRQVLGLWQKQLAEHPNQVRVLANAALWLKHFSWLRPEYRDACKALFARMCALEPNNPEWPDQLGLICYFEAGDGLSQAPKETSKHRKRRRAAAAKSAMNFLTIAKRLRAAQERLGNSHVSESHYIQIAELTCWRANRSASAVPRSIPGIIRLLT